MGTGSRFVSLIFTNVTEEGTAAERGRVLPEATELGMEPGAPPGPAPAGVGKQEVLTTLPHGHRRRAGRLIAFWYARET